MRLVPKLMLSTLLLLAACSSVDSVISDAPNEETVDLPVLEEGPAEVPTTTRVPTTSAESAPVDEANDGGAVVAPSGRSDHLLDPWLPADVELPAESEITLEKSSWGDSSIDGCPNTEAFDLLSDWMQVEITWETSTSFGGHAVGVTPPGTSPHSPVERLAESGACLRRVLGEQEGPPIELESSVGPEVAGIISSSTIAFVDEELPALLVMATTGDRIVHVLTVRQGEVVSDEEIESMLREITGRADSANARVEECASLYTDRLERIKERRCDGFELWSPDLELRSFDENSLLDVLDEDGTTELSYYGWYPASDLLLLPEDLADGAGGQLGETDVPDGLIVCEDELGEPARLAAQFDQWLQVESHVVDPASGDEVFHTVGVAPSTDAAVAAVRAYATFDACESFTRAMGASSFRSEHIDDLPPRVVEGMLWTIGAGESTTVIGDFALDNGVVTSISVSSQSADVESVRQLLAKVLAKLPAYEARVDAAQPEVEPAD